MRFDAETHTLHAGGRSWQADPAGTEIDDRWYGQLSGWSGDPSYGQRTRRCIVRFESGWSASIVWGSGSYSTNHDAWHEGDPFTEEPTTVEVGVVDHTGELRMRRHTDDADGSEWSDVEIYLDDDELVELLDQLAALSTDHDFGEPSPTMEEVEASLQRYLEVRDADG